ncbi:MAG TPA: hypothetical protein VN611_14675 [Patescibacteria group bacterium]|nr:hypothetical protein [Patescibacteria group bacterium]
MMKKKVFSVLLMVFLLGTGVCFAAPDIPNLVGTWAVQSEGAYLSKGGEPGTWSHYRENSNTLTAELIVTKQQGRVFYGTFTSQRATEDFAGVIGWDNKTFYLVDQDGFTDGTIVDNNKLTCIYRHVGDKDSVVAAGVLTRKK